MTNCWLSLEWCFQLVYSGAIPVARNPTGFPQAYSTKVLSPEPTTYTLPHSLHEDAPFLLWNILFSFFRIVFIYLFDKEFFTPQCRGQKQKLEMYKVCTCRRNRKWKRKSRQSWGNKSTYTDSADILFCFFSCTSWCRILYKFYLHVV